MSGDLNGGRLGAPVGGEWVSTGWRVFFWAACIFNFVIGALGMLSPEATTDARIVGLLVFGFGIVYLLVAREPLRFAPTLWAGVIGKLGVVALLVPEAMAADGAYASMQIPILTVLALDAVFALGFLAFLMTKGDDLDPK